MAEVLGVVASGIAVVQAVQTVGHVVSSLTQLWKEVKDAPETSQNILDELEVAGELATAIEAELQSPLSAWPNDAGRAPLTSLECFAMHGCRQVYKNLDDLVNDLAADIASSRRRKRLAAKTRVVLKKETLTNYEKRLQKALLFLNAALQLNLA